MEQEKEILLQIIESSPHYIFWKDENLSYAGCSNCFAEAIGYDSPADIIGKTDHQLPWDEGYADQHQDEDRTVLSTGRSILRKKMSLSLPHRTEDDRKVLSVNKTPLYSDTNKIVGVLCHGVDITEQELAYKKLTNESEVTAKFLREAGFGNINAVHSDHLKASVYINALYDYYNSIISCMPGNIYWLNRECILMGGNDNLAKMFGLNSKDDLIGLTYEKMSALANWTEGQGESFRSVELEVMQSGMPRFNIEEPPVVVNGEKKYYIANKVPIFNKEGTVIGVAGISIDITDKKKITEELLVAKQAAEAASRAKSTFIANMSHDLRTPITGILGLLQEIVDTAENPTIRENARLSIIATSELLQLTNEVLEVSKLEAGHLDQQIESFDLWALLERNLNLLKPVAQHRKLHLSLTRAETIPQYVMGFYLYLDRCILNLISNALKFTETGSVKLEAKLCSVGDYNDSATPSMTPMVGDRVTLQLSVKDTGIGIPADQFDTIFEHFSRLTPAYQGSYSGAGLGLYTVKQYVQAMQGQITIDSQVQKGTQFTLTLPVTVSDHADHIKPPSFAVMSEISLTSELTPTSPAAPTRAMQKIESDTISEVLLVEDHPLAARMAKRLLEKAQCFVRVAQTGADALAQLQQHNVSLILMDVGLPDLSGLEVCRRIRLLPNQQTVPIIALTGHLDPECRKECIAAGMNDLLNKPIHEIDLQTILHRFVFKSTSAYSSTASITSTTLTDSAIDSAIIDWKGSVRRLGGDTAIAKEMFAMLADTLKSSQTILEAAYQARDRKALEDELHKMIGGLCYLNVPRLLKASQALQAAIQAGESPHRGNLDILYKNLRQEINTFTITYRKIIQKEA